MNSLNWEYKITRSEYDIQYFIYERNPENDNNLIPAMVEIAAAPCFHHELVAKL